MTLRLETPEGAPYRYEITLLDTGDSERRNRRMIVSGDPGPPASERAPEPRFTHTHEYTFRRNDHASYLDLFDQLARDYSLRRPLAREPQVSRADPVHYEALLTSNCAPGILYGYGDPAVLRVDGNAGPRYYMTCTSNDAPNAFPILRSTDVRTWEHVGYVFPQGHTPEWAAEGEGIADFWAPELHLVRNEYRVYFVARHAATRELCVGVAHGCTPAGPFVAAPEPLLKGGAIDPHVLVESDGEAVLYWKEDSNAIWPMVLSRLLHRAPTLIPELFRSEADRRTASFTAALFPWLQTLEPMERFLAEQNLIESVTSRFIDFERRLARLAGEQRREGAALREMLQHLKTRMFARRLTDDGLSLTGEAVKVLENDQPWEAHVVEGMSVLKYDGQYFMFYAGNDFSTADYAINVAVSGSKWGPFQKLAVPFLRSSADWSGPGHPSVAIGPNGDHVLFLHAYRPGDEAYKAFRAFLALPFVFENGLPRPRP
jgi:hypothetical protein